MKRRNVVLLLALVTSMLATIAAAQTSRAAGDREQRQARPAVFSPAQSAQLQPANWNDHSGRDRDDRAYSRGRDRVRVYGYSAPYYGGYVGGYVYAPALPPAGYYDQWGVWHPYGWYDVYGYWHPYR